MTGRLSTALTSTLLMLVSCTSSAPVAAPTRPSPSPAPSPSGDFPECIRRILLPAYLPPPPYPALRAWPRKVRPGDTVTIRGSGLPARKTIHIIGWFGDDECEINSTGGDTFVGEAFTDTKGNLSARLKWPERFDPYAGRDLGPIGALPAGRYYLVGGPCQIHRVAWEYCPGAERGTRPGLPVVMSRRSP